MDFFKSVFSDEQDPEETDSQAKSDSDHEETSPNPINDSTVGGSSSAAGAGGWSFGGLIQTLTTKSESVLETYRRDLKEFGSGLKKEIEVAQGSIENVSHKIDEIGTSVWKGTAQIISQGKDAILAIDNESDSDNYSTDRVHGSSGHLGSKKYSRFDAQIHMIQCDMSTYCDEPEDLEEYEKWKLGFSLDDNKSEEIDSLFEENGEMESIYKKVVPGNVDHGSFWCRYFYRVYKLKQAEDLRAKLVNRANEEEEELTWDVDEDDDSTVENISSLSKANVNVKEEEPGSNDSLKLVKDDNLQSKRAIEVSEIQQEIVTKESERSLKKESPVEEHVVEKSGDNLDTGHTASEGFVSKSDEKVGMDIKGDGGESGKDSDCSIVSSQPFHEEEDLGWDEIEDLSSIEDKNDKKESQSGSPNIAEIRKRLSVAEEEEEDLSWDIEEDDDGEQIKKP